jgi:hypothetical protein
MKRVLCGLVLVLSQGCYFGENPILFEKELPGGLLLSAMDDMKNLTVWDLSEESVIGIIDATVFEIGWSDNFVIAKTHPELLSLVENRASIRQLYITKTDFITLSDSSYYIYRWIEQESNVGRSEEKTLYQLFKIPKDSIASFKKITYWHVIDIKNNKKHYIMNSEDEFVTQKTKLGIPDSLTFFLTCDELK